MFFELSRAFPGQYERKTFHKERAKDVIKAWKFLKEIQKEEAMLAEIPAAQISSILVAINSDPSKSKKLTLKDFLLFKEAPESDVFPQLAAAVAVQLAHERKLPEEFLAAWSQIIESAKKNTQEAKARGLRSDCGNAFLLAPEIKEGKIACVALVKNFLCGTVTLRDIDKTLFTIDVEVPFRKDFCYIEETSFRLARVNAI